MNCGFCGYEFDQTLADTACNGCPLVKGCPLVRCPQCGYEMPPEAKLVGWLRELRGQLEERFSAVQEILK